MLRLIRVIALKIVVLTLVSACGGGGGGGASAPAAVPVTVTFGATEISSTFYQHPSTALFGSYVPPASVKATFGALPPGEIYPVVVVDKAVFASVGVVQNEGNAYTASFTPEVTLAPGTYTGVVSLQLFKDSAHTMPYLLTGGTLPYKLVVTPRLSITVRIDGIPKPEAWHESSGSQVMMLNGSTIYWGYGAIPACTLTLKAGQRIEVESNIPVTWTGSGDLYPYGGMWPASVKTSTTLQQTVPALPDNIGGMTNNAFVSMPVNGNGQYGAGFCIDITK